MTAPRPINSTRLRELLKLRQQVEWNIEEERARLGQKHRTTTAEQILDMVAAYYLVDKRDLISHDRTRLLAEARHVAMWIIRHRHGLSLPQIGAVFNRDHTTILYAIRRVDDTPRLQFIARDIQTNSIGRAS